MYLWKNEKDFRSVIFLLRVLCSLDFVQTLKQWIEYSWLKNIILLKTDMAFPGTKYVGQGGASYTFWLLKSSRQS